MGEACGWNSDVACVGGLVGRTHDVGRGIVQGDGKGRKEVKTGGTRVIGIASLANRRHSVIGRSV